MSIKPVEGAEEKKERQNSGRVGGGGGGGGKSPAAEKMAQLKSLSPGKNTKEMTETMYQIDSYHG